MEFDGHDLKQEQERFAMNVEKNSSAVRRNLHWNRFPARLCHPHSAKQSPERPGLTLWLTLRGTGRWTSSSQPELSCDSMFCFFETKF